MAFLLYKGPGIAEFITSGVQTPDKPPAMNHKFNIIIDCLPDRVVQEKIQVVVEMELFPS